MTSRVTGPSDAQLLARARRDPVAFRAIYERYASGIEGYMARRCGDPHTAQDLAAETFARAWFAREGFRDLAGGSAGPWLFAIARSVLVSSVRSGRLEQAALKRLGLLEGFDRPPSDVEPVDTWLDGVDEILDSLPAAQRDAIRLYVVDDNDYIQIARQLETTPEVVRARVSRGLRALRIRMTTDGGLK